jgi:hypothetical protein
MRILISISLILSSIITNAQITLPSYQGVIGPKTVVAPVAIGDIYQGGMIVYLLQSGDPGYSASVQHGIIISTVDQSTGIFWGTASSTVASSGAIGAGSGNTTGIVNATTSEANAAKLCDDLVLNGYSDWYLPSEQELMNMVIYKTLFPAPLPSGNYWTSTGLTTTNNTNKATVIIAGAGLTYASKSNSNRVRAVRSF